MFQSDRAGRSKLFAVDLATRAVAPITTGADHHDVDPTCSNDGRRVAFATTRFDGRTFDIAVAQADGTAVARVTSHLAYERFPAWAPDGASLYFASEQDGTQAVFRVWPASERVERVSPSRARGLHPAPAPDGRRLAYTAGTEDGLHVHVRDLDAGIDHRVDEGDDDAAWPTWSRDGSRLAFVRLRPGAAYLQVVALETRAVTSIAIAGVGGLREPVWSPDGTWLAVAASADATEPGQDWDLLLVSTSASAAFRVTTGKSHDTRPVWAPQ